MRAICARASAGPSGRGRRDLESAVPAGPGEIVWDGKSDTGEIVSSGVCHSDVSVQNGTIPSGTPTVLGHEGAGIVQEVGEAVSSVAAGDWSRSE